MDCDLRTPNSHLHPNSRTIQNSHLWAKWAQNKKKLKKRNYLILWLVGYVSIFSGEIFEIVGYSVNVTPFTVQLTVNFHQNWPSIFRHPLMLPCQHVYCYGCLYQLKRENNFKCPYCQIPIDSKFEDLPQPRSGHVLLKFSE